MSYEFVFDTVNEVTVSDFIHLLMKKTVQNIFTLDVLIEESRPDYYWFITIYQALKNFKVKATFHFSHTENIDSISKLFFDAISNRKIQFEEYNRFSFHQSYGRTLDYNSLIGFQKQIELNLDGILMIIKNEGNITGSQSRELKRKCQGMVEGFYV